MANLPVDENMDCKPVDYFPLKLLQVYFDSLMSNAQKISNNDLKKSIYSDIGNIRHIIEMMSHKKSTYTYNDHKYLILSKNSNCEWEEGNCIVINGDIVKEFTDEEEARKFALSQLVIYGNPIVFRKYGIND